MIYGLRLRYNVFTYPRTRATQNALRLLMNMIEPDLSEARPDTGRWGPERHQPIWYALLCAYHRANLLLISSDASLV